MVTAIARLFEAHLNVADLDASIAFYRDRLGLELAHVVPARQAAFFWIGARGHTMLGLWGAGAGPQKTTTHIAFSAALDDVIAAPRTLRSTGITALDFNGDPTDEPVVFAWMPAASVYFRDPDGNLLEYIAMLEGDPRPDGGVLTWRAWDRAVRYTIAAPRREDLTWLPSIELAAARLLVGHAPASVLNETTSLDVLEEARRAGHLWVALADGVPVGFALVRLIEHGAVHLEEIDVHPEHGRRGVGTKLVWHVCQWAASNGCGSVTLTTFRDLAWNLPFYARLGFDVVPSAQLSSSLRAVVEDETRRGFDPSRRVVMARPSMNAPPSLLERQW